MATSANDNSYVSVVDVAPADNSTSSSKKIKMNVPGDELVVLIYHEDTFYYPAIEDGVTWTTIFKGSPGKVTFKMFKDSKLQVSEGDVVEIFENGVGIFYGFIFDLQYSKDTFISVTAYDQIRYLKNKDIVSLINVKASDVLQKISDDYSLNLGEVDDTAYVIPKIHASNRAMIDTLQRAISMTSAYVGKLYVLYCDYDKLCLKDIEDDKLTVPILIDAETGQDFKFDSSIDKNTYNYVKLFYDNKETGYREVWIAKSSKNINRWGLLKRVESVNAKKPINFANKATVLLNLGNSVKRKLSFTGVAGDSRIVAGKSLYVALNVSNQIEIGTNSADGSVNAQKMIVTRVTHKFANHEHTMDLEVYMKPYNPSATSTTKVTSENGTVTTITTPSEGTLDDSTQKASQVSLGLSAGADAWVGASADCGQNGCAEGVGKIGSYYSPFLAQESNNQVYRVDQLVADAGNNVIPFDASQLQQGDCIVYDDDDHVVIYDGAGGYYGNSSSTQDASGNYGVFVRGGDYTQMGGMTPTKIIKTSQI